MPAWRRRRCAGGARLRTAGRDGVRVARCRPRAPQRGRALILNGGKKRLHREHRGGGRAQRRQPHSVNVVLLSSEYLCVLCVLCGERFANGYGRSTVAPVVARDSSVRCASAASFSANVCRASDLILPASTSANSLSAIAVRLARVAAYVNS